MNRFLFSYRVLRIAPLRAARSPQQCNLFLREP